MGFGVWESGTLAIKSHKLAPFGGGSGGGKVGHLLAKIVFCCIVFPQGVGRLPVVTAVIIYCPKFS